MPSQRGFLRIPGLAMDIQICYIVPEWGMLDLVEASRSPAKEKLAATFLRYACEMCHVTRALCGASPRESKHLLFSAHT
ncbi:hypothetical protein CEXT_616881 [Caerostris extrusa]|uniref:Uncharacterized protein n=1 Tax=Caerostris extrusa TaxID=172846 RepID=A0AAV4QTG3_CAEEX|nr:hypothetical protein CEXT_616881 [Caerostris extrusa]